MKDKKWILIVVALVVLVAAGAFFALRNTGTADSEPAESNEDVVDTDDSFENGIVFDEEEEDAEIVKVDKPAEDFVGSWSATSDMSAYLYGNIDVTIKDDGTWSGNITEEDVSGTWTKEGTDLHLVSDDGDIDLLFAFTENGTLIMQRDLSDEGEESEYVNTVLTKK